MRGWGRGGREGLGLVRDATTATRAREKRNRCLPRQDLGAPPARFRWRSQEVEWGEETIRARVFPGASQRTGQRDGRLFTETSYYVQHTHDRLGRGRAKAVGMQRENLTTPVCIMEGRT